MIAKELSSTYKPGERKGMVKIKRLRTADVVVVGWRPGKEENTVGALILGVYDGDELRVVGHTSGLTAKRKRELVSELAPYETGDRGSGDPSRWTSGRDLEWVTFGPSWWSRSPSTTSRRTASATGRSSCAGATTRIRASAPSTSSSSSAPERKSAGPWGAGALERF